MGVSDMRHGKQLEEESGKRWTLEADLSPEKWLVKDVWSGEPRQLIDDSCEQSIYIGALPVLAAGETCFSTVRGGNVHDIRRGS